MFDEGKEVSIDPKPTSRAMRTNEKTKLNLMLMLLIIQHLLGIQTNWGFFGKDIFL